MTQVDCLVVGAGPAGLAAAAEVARRNAEVLVVDERAAPGGHLAVPGVDNSGDARAVVRDLVAGARDSGATLLTGTVAWGVFPEGTVGLLMPGESVEIRARTLILAAGAADRLLPFPGWHLPSVMTADAALALCAQGPAARRRWVVAGAAGRGLALARSLLTMEQDVVALVEADAGVDVRALAADGVRVLPGYTVCRTEGAEYVQAVECDPPGQGAPLRLEADALAVAWGRRPAVELAWVAGCRMEFRPDRGGHVPVRNSDLETSMEGVFVAGDAAGPRGVRIATCEGRLAGFAAARRLGLVPDEEWSTARPARRDALGAAAAQEEPAARREADALWHLEERYVRRALEAGDVWLCRCEKVTAAAVRRAVEEGACAPADVKRMTRAGMGECQSADCRPLLVRAVALLRGESPEVVPPLSHRPPVRVVSVGRLIG